MKEYQGKNDDNKHENMNQYINYGNIDHDYIEDEDKCEYESDEKEIIYDHVFEQLEQDNPNQLFRDTMNNMWIQLPQQKKNQSQPTF